MTFQGSARFEIRGKLGEGGMGVVYDVFDRDRQMRVALKSLRSVDAVGLYCFKREFRALTDLSHPNIVQLLELIEEDGAWFLTMEVVEGVDFLRYVRNTLGEAEKAATDALSAEADTSDAVLSQAALESTTWRGGLDPGLRRGHLAERPSVPAPVAGSRAAARAEVGAIVDIPRLRDALRQLALALHALHQCGLVHRDLKPSNIRVTPQHRVMLMDFGIVAELQAPPLGGSLGQVAGTPAFMAPEQARGSPPTAAADWYAVGVMLYLALTEQLPFTGSESEIVSAKQRKTALPPSHYVADVPAELEALCMDLLQREALARPSGPEILERLGITATPSPPLRANVRESTFVGRESELAQLHRLFAAARAGGCVRVVVEGTSGIGKTKLVDHFIAELQGAASGPRRAIASETATAPLVLAGRCHQREIVAFKALDGVVDALSLFLAGLQPGQRRSLLPADLSLLARLFPVLARLPECRCHRGVDSEPVMQRTRAFAALRDLLGAIAAQRPVLLRIEDLQWADAVSIDLLCALLGPEPAANVLLLATYQTDASRHSLQGGWRLPELAARLGMQRISLGPLSDTEQQHLVNQLGAPHAYLDHPIWTESAGHPMLLAELVRYFEEESESAMLPGTLRLETVLGRRIQLLPEPARCLLSVVALATEPLPLPIVGTAAELAPQARERAATALVAAHLVRVVRSETGEPWVESSHEQVRQAMLAQLTPAQQRQHSARLAEGLQAWGAASYSMLAHQWHCAGEPVRAAHFLVEAAVRAIDQAALEHAAALCFQALQQLDAAQHADDREADAVRSEAWLTLAKARRLVNAADPELWGYLDHAQALALRVGRVESLATIHYLRGSALFPRGDVMGCLAQHERARDYARQAGSPLAEARALSGLGDAYLLQGRLQSAHRHYDACIMLCGSHGLDDVEAANLPMRGMTRYFRNELAAGLDDCICAMATAVRIGSHRAELIASSGAITWILLDLGMLSDAQEQIDRALRLSRRLDNKRFEAHAIVNQARLDAVRGQPILARQRAQQALILCQGQGAALTAPLALGLLSLLASDPAERKLALRQGEQILRDGMPNPACLLFLRDALQACIDHDDLDGIESFAQQLEQHTQDEPMPWSTALSRRARGLLRVAASQKDPASTGRAASTVAVHGSRGLTH